MQSLAQKKAKENFKKAIAYRKKTGCSLKEAFAHIYGKKVGAVKKAASKKAAVKKAAPKKNAGFVKTVKLGTKKKVTYTKKSEVKPKKQPVRLSGIEKLIVSYNKNMKKQPIKQQVEFSSINDKKKAIDTLMLMEHDLRDAMLRLEEYKSTAITNDKKDFLFKNITIKRKTIKRVLSEIKARKKGVLNQFDLVKKL